MIDPSTGRIRIDGRDVSDGPMVKADGEQVVDGVRRVTLG